MPKTPERGAHYTHTSMCHASQRTRMLQGKPGVALPNLRVDQESATLSPVILCVRHLVRHFQILAERAHAC